MNKIEKFFYNMRCVVDQSAWLLLAPVLVALYFVDPAVVKTMVQWTLLAAAVMGFTLIVSRISFPGIRLSKLLEQVNLGNVAAAIVVAALMLYVALLFLILALWAKP